MPYSTMTEQALVFALYLCKKKTLVSILPNIVFIYKSKNDDQHEQKLKQF